jgi:hypothetical protein
MDGIHHNEMGYTTMKPKQGDVYVNVPNSKVDGSRKVFCPLCYYDLRDVPMVFDPTAQVWICNYCKYAMLKHQNPVESPTISAGNDMETARPYMKAVSFTKSLQKQGKSENFMSAKQAWDSD